MIETGIDIVEINRIKKSINSYGDKFISRIFTEKEIEYCQKKAKPEENFAVRFAAKEAVMKIYGTGWGEGIKWTDIEIINNKSGKPILNLYNKALEFKKKLRLSDISISLSHTKNYATAVAVAI